MSINLSEFREFLKFRNKSPSHNGVEFHHTVEVKNSMELLKIIITDSATLFLTLCTFRRSSNPFSLPFREHNGIEGVPRNPVSSLKLHTKASS